MGQMPTKVSLVEYGKTWFVRDHIVRSPAKVGAAVSGQILLLALTIP